jgi:hypothetical protein
MRAHRKRAPWCMHLLRAHRRIPPALRASMQDPAHDIHVGDYVGTRYRGGTREGYVDELEGGRAGFTTQRGKHVSGSEPPPAGPWAGLASPAEPSRAQLMGPASVLVRWSP